MAARVDPKDVFSRKRAEVGFVVLHALTDKMAFLKAMKGLQLSTGTPGDDHALWAKASPPPDERANARTLQCATRAEGMLPVDGVQFPLSPSTARHGLLLRGARLRGHRARQDHQRPVRLAH